MPTKREFILDQNANTVIHDLNNWASPSKFYKRLSKRKNHLTFKKIIMALTPSDFVILGTIAPSFNLLDTVSNKHLSLDDLKGSKGTAIFFICNHCPFVIHINKTLVSLANIYQEKGIAFIAISSNDVANYPQDRPDKMKLHAKQENYSFSYLYDESQEVAKAYGATCTPDIYLYNSDLELCYHGQFDDSRPGNNIDCDGKDLSRAMDNLLLGQPTSNQKPSIGCSIKWK